MLTTFYECEKCDRIYVGLPLGDEHRCPECDVVKPRWKVDPYLVVHSDIAYEKGFLKGDLNPVQDIMLMSHLIRNQESKNTEREEQFEQQMLLQNPQMYEAYRQAKEDKDSDGISGEIEWRTPQTIEEAAEISKAFAELEQKVKQKETQLPKALDNTEDSDTLQGRSLTGQVPTISLLDEEDLAQLRDIQ